MNVRTKCNISVWVKRHITSHVLKALYTIEGWVYEMEDKLTDWAIKDLGEVAE